MDKIEQALLRTTDTKRLLLGSGVLEKVPAMFADLFAGQTALVGPSISRLPQASHLKYHMTLE